MMENVYKINRNLFFLIVLVIIPALYSGCKSKQKLTKTSSMVDKGIVSTADSSRLIAQRQSLALIVDSTRDVYTGRSSTINRHSVELHFKLDSSKNLVPQDTNGNLNINRLINSALRGATSLIIKVEDQQAQLQEKIKDNQSKKSNLASQIDRKDSTGIKKRVDNKNLTEKNKTANVKKDPAIKVNSSLNIWLLVLGIVAGVIFFWIKSVKGKS